MPPADAESVARAVIADVAPDELPYLDAAAARFRSDPDRPPATSGRDDALGFGEHVGLALSPFALWLTQEVLTFAAGLARPVVARATLPLRSRVSRLLRRIPLVRRLARSEERPAPVPTERLSAAELATVRSVCLDRAAAVGLPSQTAELLTDAIIGRLASTP